MWLTNSTTTTTTITTTAAMISCQLVPPVNLFFFPLLPVYPASLVLCPVSRPERPVMPVVSKRRNAMPRIPPVRGAHVSTLRVSAAESSDTSSCHQCSSRRLARTSTMQKARLRRRALYVVAMPGGRHLRLP